MPQHANSVSEYRFEDCRVLIQVREIYRAGMLVSAEPKVFDLLTYLILHRDRAVDKNELQDEIWPGAIVTEASLTRCVMKARRVIGDKPKAPTGIKTIRGHGYRFSLDVEEIGLEPAGRPKLPLPSKPSVAVLPFANLSGDPEQDYFSEGISEDIITELSRIRSIFVIARHSSFIFKKADDNIKNIAEDLGVAYIVDGSVRKSAGKVRVNVRLADAQRDVQIWSERYDRELEDLLLLQDDVTAAIAATIGGRVEATRARKRLDGSGVEAYDLLMQAQALYYVVSRDAAEQARALLERAIEIDPHNARALGLLAAVYSMMSWSFWAADNEAARKRSSELGRRSLELDDSDSLTQALVAEILFDCGSPELAEHHFRRALALNPNDIAARALFASKLAASGRADEGLEHLAVGERLDPFGLSWIPWVKGFVMFSARRFDESASALMSMANPPNEARFLLAASLGRLNRRSEAKAPILEFLHCARQEMPNYPGDTLDEWTPYLARMVDYGDIEDFEFLIESLRLAGWD